MTLIVNLYGQPGSGKSTTRADVFRILKQNGVNAEECYELAKKLTWSKRHEEIVCQPYIFGKSVRDLEVLMGKVDVIITDSPLMLCRFYTELYRPDTYPASFLDCISETAKGYGGANYFLNAVKPYQTAGRNQTADEANEIGHALRQMLDRHQIVYTTLPGNERAGPRIAAEILERL